MRNYTLIHLVYVVILDILLCLRCIFWNVFWSCFYFRLWLRRVKSNENNRLCQNNKNNIKGKKGKYNYACSREVSRNSRVYTRSDNKVMRLATKSIFLFINYNQLHRDTNFFHPQFFSQYQMNGFPVHIHFISNHLDCKSSIVSNKFCFPCCVVTCPCCWCSSAKLLIFNKFSASRKHFVPAKGLCSWHCIISKGLLKFLCVVVTLSPSLTNTQKGIPLRDVPCFHFHDRVHKRILTNQGPTPHWGNIKPCHCKWWWRKDQSQRLSVLAGYSIASTARRKLILLLYFRTSYLRILILNLCVVGD